MERFPVFVFLAISGLAFGVRADFSNDVQSYLKEFYQDSAKVMNQRLLKRDAQGNIIPSIESLFSDQDIQSGQYIKIKDLTRSRHCTVREGKKICLDEAGEASIGANDHVED